jgi:hypothetical protein
MSAESATLSLLCRPFGPQLSKSKWHWAFRPQDFPIIEAAVKKTKPFRIPGKSSGRDARAPSAPLRGF